MKILVITPCTAKKKYSPSNQLKPADFESPEQLKKRTRELKKYETPAAKMYTGPSHTPVKEGVGALRRHEPDIVGWHIVSPGYGLLHEEDPIVPYDYDFKGLGDGEIRYRGKELGIREEIQRMLPSYDMVFFLLGKRYVTACRLPFRVPNPVTQIFLVAPKSQDRILADGRHVHAVCVGDKLIRQFDEANKNNLKGVVFERLCRVARDQGLPVFGEVKRNPQRMIEMVLECNKRL